MRNLKFGPSTQLPAILLAQGLSQCLKDAISRELPKSGTPNAYRILSSKSTPGQPHLRKPEGSWETTVGYLRSVEFARLKTREDIWRGSLRKLATIITSRLLKPVLNHGCHLSKINLGRLAFKFLSSIVTGVALTILNPLYWEPLIMIGISMSRTNEWEWTYLKGKTLTNSRRKQDQNNKPDIFQAKIR
jgi:hypothetical protein